MSRSIKVCIRVVVFVVVIPLVVAAILPMKYQVEESLFVNVSQRDAFQYIADLRNHKLFDWNLSKVPSLQQSFEGQVGRAGSLLNWQSESDTKTSGTLEILSVKSDEEIEFKLIRTLPTQSKYSYQIIVTEAGEDRSELRIAIQQSVSYPENLLCKIYQYRMKSEIRDSLQRLQKLLLSSPADL